jgi:hypothetical protein
MAPIPFFADLRQAVISGPIPPKRMPKWYWSLSPESALLLQPSDRRGCLFSGLVLDGPNITRETFRRPQGQRPRAIRALDFWIFDGDPDGSVWQFRPRSGFSPPEAAGAFRDVVLARLTPAVCANVDAVALLVPQCLVCGKVLTDPVSQARWIGPECAGRSRSLPPSLRLRVQLLPDLAGGHLAHPLDVEPEA